MNHPLSIAALLAMLFNVGTAIAQLDRTREIQAAINVATQQCNNAGAQMAECYDAPIICSIEADGRDLARFHACLNRTPWGANPLPPPVTTVRRGDQICTDTTIPGVMFNTPVQRKALAAVFVEEIAEDRVKLSVAGVHLVNASQVDANMQVVGAPTYRGTVLANGNTLWIEKAWLADWRPCR